MAWLLCPRSREGRPFSLGGLSFSFLWRVPAPFLPEGSDSHQSHVAKGYMYVE